MSSPSSLPLPAPQDDPARQYSLAFLLADVLRLMRSEFRRQASGLGLTPALSRLLFYVDEQPGCSQAELASFLDVTSATIGRMIDRLESGGFVRRLPDASDRRAFRIHLDTAAGPLVEQMHAALARTGDRALLGIAAVEEAAMRRALERMRANLSSGLA